MVGKTKVVVQAPDQFSLPMVVHIIGNFTFEFREEIVSMAIFVVLSKGTFAGIQLVKYIHSGIILNY
jgi:hypothetical protein